MLNRNDFFQYVKDNVLDYLPDSFGQSDIHLQEVVKNNDTVLTGIIIREAGSSIVPNIFLDSFYELYRAGKDLDACVADVADFRIEKQELGFPFDLNFLSDYELVKDKLQVRICDPETNHERLSGKAVTEHGDFAAYYNVIMSVSDEVTASFSVTNAMLADWGISVEQLHQDALAADTKRGAVLLNLEQEMVFMNFGLGKPDNLLENGENPLDTDLPMFCLSNESKLHGASMILHDDLRRRIGEMLRSDYFVIPSSVHEMMIVPDNGAYNAYSLNMLVQSVNASEVSAEDRLSDKVQFCDGKTGVMENAQKRELRMEQEKSGIRGKLDKAKAEVKSAEGSLPISQQKEKAAAMSI
jgi:hypothetical protein